MSSTEPRTRTRARRAEREPHGAGPPLPTHAYLPPALFAAVLLLAPPTSNFFWGVNGLRSLAPAAALLVLIAAAGASFLGRIRTGNVLLRWTLVVVVGWLIAFPLREKIHLLGDTQLRIRTLAMAGAGWLPLFASWWARLHANPLDIVVDVLGVSALRGLGLSVIQAVSLVSWGLGVTFAAGCWRLAGRLGAERSTQWGMAAALALSGVLVAFAGYAESAGLVAVTAVWWWAEFFAPLATRGQPWRLAGAFVALVLTHRVGVVMALPLLWRTLGPAWPADERAERRLAQGLALAALVALALVTVTTSAGRQLAVDARDLLASARTGHAAASDMLNALLLVAPLAVLAPLVSGRAALRDWLRSPGAIGIGLAAAPLLVAVGYLYPVAAYSLGPQREWEANLLSGITLTAAGAAILGRVAPARRRALLALLLPALALCAASWLAVNADREAATRRAELLAERPSTLTPSQSGYLQAYLGQRAMDEGRAELGGLRFERAFDLGGNARRALMATEAWLLAGDLRAARRTLAKARSRGSLGPELEASARRLEELVAEAAADSARQSREPAPAPGR